MEFIDPLHVKGEMSDKEFEEKVKQEAATRDRQRYGLDGMFVVFEEHRTHRGIPYLIKILRYYVIDKPLDQMRGMNDYGKWAVLEYTEEMKLLADFLGTIEETTGLYEFLWQDALHYNMKSWTLPAQVNWLDEQAHEDIDKLFTLKDVITYKMNETVSKYDELMTAFNSSNKIKEGQ